MKKIILISTILVTFIFCEVANYSKSINMGLANNMLRLHVVANSNSKNDQLLKLKIRDKILEYVGTILQNSRNIDETQYIISQNLDNIYEVVKNYLAENNLNYDVNLRLGEFPFPTKSYGDVILPAGKYQALKVLIGEAKGNNWWCVLFPPLCFVDATHGELSIDAKQKLKNELTKEEYDIITCTKNSEDIPIKVKFKAVELFQVSKQNIAKLVSKF